MTVPATARRAGPYNGNGATTSFSFSFKTFAAGDLLVTRTDASGIETALVLNSDYSVTLNGDQDASPGGSITYPLSGSALPAGQKLTIVGDLEYEQTTDLLGGGAFNARTIEDTFDRTVIQIQQLEERADRALTLPVSSTASPILPAPEASKIIGWDVNGTGMQNYDIPDLFSGAVYADWIAETFTGTGAQTLYILQRAPGAVGNCDVSIAGVTQVPNVDFTLSGNTVSFTTAPANGLTILVRYGSAATQVSSTFSTETAIATAAQTVFNLASVIYVPGANAMAVYVNGLRMVAGVDYLETSTTRVTFTSGLTQGDEVLFIAGRTINDAIDSSSVSFLQAGSTSPRTAQAKMRDVVSALDFGADPTGAVDSTTAIQAAIAKAATTNGGKVYLPVGTYKISNPGLTVPTGVWLIGDSATPVGPGTVLIPASAAVTRMIAMPGVDAGLENLMLLGEATKSVIGVDIGHLVAADPDTPGRLTFRNVVARLCKWGFHCLNGPFLLRWESCVGWDCLKGWYFDNTGSHLARGVNIASLENCHGVSNDQQGLLAVASIAVSIDSCGFDSDAEGIRGEDVTGLYVSNTTMDLSTTASFSIIGCTFEIRGCVTDQSQLPFTIQTGTLPSKGVIRHCKTSSTVGSVSVAPATNQWIDFIENTFDKAIQNDGQRFGHGERTESGSLTITASGTPGLLTQAVTFSRAFSNLRAVVVTPVSQFSRRINTLVSSVTNSGFTAEFQRDDGSTWNNGEIQTYYWFAIGDN